MDIGDADGCDASTQGSEGVLEFRNHASDDDVVSHKLTEVGLREVWDEGSWVGGIAEDAGELKTIGKGDRG